MRTTLSIDDELLDRAKRKAAAGGITLGHLVEDALRRELASVGVTERHVTLPVFDGGALVRGIDPSSTRALYEALDHSA